MFWASGVSEVGGVLKRLDNKFMNSILCILRIGNCWPSAYYCIALQLKSAAQRVKCIGVNVLRLDSNPLSLESHLVIDLCWKEYNPTSPEFSIVAPPIELTQTKQWELSL